MSDPREIFLHGLGWDSAHATALAGDASSRRYDKLEMPDGQSAILMLNGGSADDIERFVTITNHLRDHGFSAPKILGAAASDGLLLLENLGDALFAKLIARDPSLETALYEAATDALVTLHSVTPPPGLTVLTPDEMVRMTEITFTHYAGVEMPVDLALGLGEAFRSLSDSSRCLALRDFHAENLIWMADREGLGRVGLLDYQDAVLAHPAYDLMSLLQDIRRDVTPAIKTAMIDRFTSALGFDPVEFLKDATLISAQRNLRILGVFARLSLTLGKPGYVELIPRVWTRLGEDLSHPAHADLHQALFDILPEPTDDFLDTLRQRSNPCPAQ